MATMVIIGDIITVIVTGDIMAIIIVITTSSGLWDIMDITTVITMDTTTTSSGLDMAADFHIHIKRKKLDSFISKTTTANILLFSFPFCQNCLDLFIYR